MPYCAFALSENTQAFLPVFKQAILRRGIPQRLYVDNGANYRSQQLALVCAKLGIALIHARPYQPQGKGKMERCFAPCAPSCCTRLSAADTASLEALNRRLWAWVEGEYHHTPASRPRRRTRRWSTGPQRRRGRACPAPASISMSCSCSRPSARSRATAPSASTAVLFEVDAALVGETVMLRYDPSAPAGARHPGLARGPLRRAAPSRVDAYANCFVTRATVRHADPRRRRAQPPRTRARLRPAPAAP